MMETIELLLEADKFALQGWGAIVLCAPGHIAEIPIMGRAISVFCAKVPGRVINAFDVLYIFCSDWDAIS